MLGEKQVGIFKEKCNNKLSLKPGKYAIGDIRSADLVKV